MALKVSIIIPYNIDRGYLGDAVKSAEHQEEFQLNKDYEIIVQHGGSLGENYNAAIKKAKGEYIKGLAEDDMLAPGCLKTLYNYAIENNTDFTCADAYCFEQTGQPTDRVNSTIPATVRELAEKNTIHGGTILYRKAVMPEWNVTHWTGEEYAVTLTMAESGCKFGYINEVVYWYRIHYHQKSLVYKSTDGETIKKRYRFIRDTIQADFINSQRIIKKS